MFLIRLISVFGSFLMFFPSIFRPIIAILFVLSFVFIIFEIVSSLWRLIGR